MAVRVIDAFNQFFDNDGNPLALGKVETFIPTTSTHLATFTDATGGTSHSNPIVLDSDGRPTSPIYWTVGASYKAQLSDANDVVLDTNLVIAIPDVAAAPSEAFDVAYYFLGGPPTSSEEIFRYDFARDVDFLANWSGAQGSVGTNPTASFVETVKKNGSTVGTITTNTSGVSTFATSAGAAVSFSAGDVMTVVAPSGTDATVANIARTFAGTLG